MIHDSGLVTGDCRLPERGSKGIAGAAAASSSGGEMAALKQLPIGSAKERQDFIVIDIVGHDKDGLPTAIFVFLSMGGQRRAKSDGERAQE
jgi:hypothetical protein